MNKDIETLLEDISKKKEVLSSMRPLTQDELNRLQEEFIIETTYNSNAIEGSTMTLDETYLIIKEGMTVSGKSIKEHLEIIGFKEAFDFILDLSKKKKAPLSERDILDIHYLVLQDNKQSRGVYRNVPVRVGSHIAPQPYMVRPLMEELLRDNKEWLKENPLTAVSKLHLEFETIHPFIDGNGRTGRLLLNLELIKNGYLPINIKYKDIQQYYDCFNAYRKNNSKDYSKMLELVARYELEELNRYIDIIKTKEEMIQSNRKISVRNEYER